MKIECDPAKDKINQKKHGISLAAADGMDLAKAAIVLDERYDYGEERFQATGMIGERLHFMAFTMRGETLWPISLRRANKREVKRYGKKD